MTFAKAGSLQSALNGKSQGNLSGEVMIALIGIYSKKKVSFKQKKAGYIASTHLTKAAIALT